jgi:hypothetical protein
VTRQIQRYLDEENSTEEFHLIWNNLTKSCQKITLEYLLQNYTTKYKDEWAALKGSIYLFELYA